MDVHDPATGRPIATTTISDFGPVLVVCPDVRTRDAARVLFGATDPGEPEAYYPVIAGGTWHDLPSRYTAAIYVPKWNVRLSKDAADRWREEVRRRLLGSQHAKTELFLT